MQLAGGGPGVALSDAAVAHTEVPGLDNHRDALRLKRLLNGVRDLGSEFLLDLEPFREDLDDSCEFGKSDDFSAGNVGHVGLPDERHHVVLAVALNIHVLEEDQLVVVFDFTKGPGQWFKRVGVVAPIVFVHRLDDPFGGVEQAFSLWIFTDKPEEGFHVSHRLDAGVAVRVEFGIRAGFEHGRSPGSEGGSTILTGSQGAPRAVAFRI